MRIKVCLPLYSEFEFAKPGLQELLACKEHQFVVEPRQGVLVGRLRNGLIADKVSSNKHQPSEKGFDYFLTVDSDIGFTLKHVLKLISHDKDIVGCPYLKHGSDIEYVCGIFKKGFPGIIETPFSVGSKELGWVEWLGAGMMLIKYHVFEKMEYPWYRHEMISIGNSQEETGEDIGFCIGAAKAGFKIWCDFDNPVEHKKRSKEDFNTDIHNIHQSEKENNMGNQPAAQPTQVEIKKDLSPYVIQANKLLTVMVEEHAKAVQEIGLCHQLISQNAATKTARDVKIQELEEKIKVFEAKEEVTVNDG